MVVTVEGAQIHTDTQIKVEAVINTKGGNSTLMPVVLELEVQPHTLGYVVYLSHYYLSVCLSVCLSIIDRLSLSGYCVFNALSVTVYYNGNTHDIL